MLYERSATSMVMAPAGASGVLGRPGLRTPVGGEAGMVPTHLAPGPGIQDYIYRAQPWEIWPPRPDRGGPEVPY